MNNDVFEILAKNFDLKEFNHELDNESEYLKQLQIMLSQKIIHLIRVDLDRLLQILYRIDIPQSDTDAAFSLGEVNQVSMALAESIIRRQLQKIQYSKKFYNK